MLYVYLHYIMAIIRVYYCGPLRKRIGPMLRIFNKLGMVQPIKLYRTSLSFIYFLNEHFTLYINTSLTFWCTINHA